MRLSVIIPAHNEAAHLRDCLDSFVAQTRIPDEVILVDDTSADTTFAIASDYAQKHKWIRVVQRKSTTAHVPGKKVVDTFMFGLQYAAPYDLIGKFDADIILPRTYFETLLAYFRRQKHLGMCSGLLYVQQSGEWVYEAIANKNHIRGPIKLYRKTCFDKIGGLRSGVGWDTVDVLLSHYHGFTTLTDPSLQVKHLRPTGRGYSTKNYKAKGEALYKMRYGLLLAKMAALKMAWQARSPRRYLQILLGYLNAVIRKTPQFVTKEEGRFIRKQRWKGICAKSMFKQTAS